MFEGSEYDNKDGQIMKQIESTYKDSIFDNGLFRSMLPSTPILDIDSDIWGYETKGHMIIDNILIKIPIWYGFRK